MTLFPLQPDNWSDRSGVWCWISAATLQRLTVHGCIDKSLNSRSSFSSRAWGISEEMLYPGKRPDNGLHPAADTPTLMLRERLGAAGDAGRYASSSRARNILLSSS